MNSVMNRQMNTMFRSGALLLAVSVAAAGCRPRAAPPRAEASSSDSAFATLQHRGEIAMGVDQYTSTHRFDDLDDGGQIQLQRDSTDIAGVATIRRHLREITAAFQRGDFRIPGFVHDRAVPGTDVMARKRDAIQYSYADLPGGGKVVIHTSDPEALSAIHAFLAFQRQDHRAAGHVHN